ncbi:MAG: methyltransferase domain-containing protein [Bacteroidota bacterium]|nr:methyltransferase domain-containing protein [Bacteroidota bacterium]
MDHIQTNKFFPLSARYNENWVKRNSLGENVLYNLESLSEVLALKPGMKVLDLGSGKAVSAIFLAKEFGVKVWAVDSKMCPSANFQRVKEMGCEEYVLPLRLDAKCLPFPVEFFDVIIAVDSFMYYGTNPEYTSYITKFLKRGGQIGIVDICFDKENNFLSHSLKNKIVNSENLNFVHSLTWWKNLWNDSGKLNVTVSEIVPENELLIKEYIKDYKYSNKNDILAEELANDKDNALKIFRMAGEKKDDDLKMAFSFH